MSWLQTTSPSLLSIFRPYPRWTPPRPNTHRSLPWPPRPGCHPTTTSQGCGQQSNKNHGTRSKMMTEENMDDIIDDIKSLQFDLNVLILYHIAFKINQVPNLEVTQTKGFSMSMLWVSRYLEMGSGPPAQNLLNLTVHRNKSNSHNWISVTYLKVSYRTCFFKHQKPENPSIFYHFLMVIYICSNQKNNKSAINNFQGFCSLRFFVFFEPCRTTMA